ncbi:alanine--tRNA ligase [Aliarcobacter butzleri]|jgi:alanyl-tRNA synthetase|uniref:Alanine--tRNA ligase n=2 Tax=Aliarcobacter butzleri TaxID=28197 RepID=SYA_ALIB4|nr:alanine--tRNA ligase [Aliarcobacter butzleri]A8EWI6.1 RecName: Full=Alanine--tRNA ligase; AltName: Full=Alanyl-tRNA synthetase; Short=AlaRS [Aliarcobacter butzleri RM4018]ABV68309.1 alanyl-tRNA synthetase [Aliarcobacter butzleri RM4018]AGR78276.1 alanyl-tRNA synthetase [Aliarcobacter butzleri 7h1h]KLD98181.1 alanyl-tRNA synthetase [Aliarcobacter butzleri L348]MCG3679078.1 alanine--tRNA ligase [Aliarcobacter butzleri]MCG3685505.1 alanine--tRNA ligase [Aliarcobacter butzleri]
MDIRKEYLEFFRSKGHEVISSMPLVPDDPTLMFTNAGMVQFKDIFTGAVPTPKNKRATSCQLCVRAGGKHNDLENVGYTARHHTLFEMLGNFSFGDYFKEDAIAYAWEFVTVNLALPIDKLWVTVHNNDDEAFDIWSKYINPSRIMRFGDKDNFWSMGDTGACGPCSEIFYDQGEENFNGEEDYMGGDGDRFLEIWNLVFMQYERTADGKLNPLPKPSIDTGMGLERVIAIKEGVFNNFDSSNFKPIIKKIEEISSKNATSENIGSYRVIADHLRACSFMLSQGILFGNEGRPYVLRRILRRAVRHGYLIGFRKPFMAKLLDTLIEIMGGHYTELVENKNFIEEQLTLEEDRFFKTIDLGMSLFNEELEKTKDIFSGVTAFKLYDTYGFPLDLTEDMLRDRGLKVDLAKFDELMNNQKAMAKAAWKGSGDTSNEGDFKQLLEKFGSNEFVGYNNTTYKSKIIALLDEHFKEVKILEKDSTGWVMLDKTPFYATSGGQNGDIGALEDNKHIAIVEETTKFHGLNLSKVKVVNSSLKQGESVDAIVVNRNEVAKHHSATHLLQSALKIVLGDTVSQAGSLNDASRLRFDFTYPKAMTKEQIDEVEDLVNSMIARGISGNVEELPIEQAKKKGAIAMFGEKYGDVVRVVSFEDVSVEFCGGTHVRNTADIGSFYIVKESGVSAGVRRIEAVCGTAAIKYTKDIISKMNEIQAEVKNSDVILGIKKLKEQIKDLKKEIETSQSKTSSPIEETIINDTKVIVSVVENGDLKKIVDDTKNANEKVAIFLLQAKDDKVLIVAGSKNTNIKAGDWIKNIAPIVGGGGGGRPDFAQAGGKDTSKIQEAKTKALDYAKENL